MLLKEEAKYYEWAGAIYSTVRSLLKPTHTQQGARYCIWFRVGGGGKRDTLP